MSLSRPIGGASHWHVGAVGLTAIWVFLYILLSRLLLVVPFCLQIIHLLSSHFILFLLFSWTRSSTSFLGNLSWHMEAYALATDTNIVNVSKISKWKMSLCLDILCQHTKFYEKRIFPYALCTETKKTHKQHFLTPKFEVLLEVKNAPFDRLLNQLGRQNPFNIVTNSWFLHIIESFHGTCYTRHREYPFFVKLGVLTYNIET
jgi:hypothetical protein